MFLVFVRVWRMGAVLRAREGAKRAMAKAEEMAARRSSGALSRTSGAGRSISPAIEDAAAATLHEGAGDIKSMLFHR